jgi:poly [ADP-ribose] polymerase
VENRKGYTLQYNEYVVYDVKQIRMRYLAKIKFNHKF